VADNDRSQSITRDLWSLRGDSSDWSAGKSQFSEWTWNYGSYSRNFFGGARIHFGNARVRMRAAQNAREQHTRRTHVIRIVGDATNFLWTINARQRVVQQRMFIVGSPTRPAIGINFDLNFLFKSVDGSRDLNFLFR